MSEDIIQEMTLQEWVDTLPIIHRARKELAELQAALDKYRWIPVSERLPEEDEHPQAIGHSKNVWCYNKVLRMPYWIDCYDTKYKTWVVCGHHYPTHWQEIVLPEDTS